MKAGNQNALEDTWLDIVEKARVGMGMDQRKLCASAGVGMDEWLAMLSSGIPDNALLEKTASTLKLGPEALKDMAHGKYRPSAQMPDGLYQIRTPLSLPNYPDGMANAYAVHIPGCNDSILFDTGTGPEALLDELEDQRIKVVRIYITHNHWDHVGSLPTLHSLCPSAPIYSYSLEQASSCMSPVEDGTVHRIGPLSIRAIHTPGHTADGMTYFLEGLEKPVVFVGDAIFAGSIGRIAENWNEGLKCIREKILSLPADSVLCPGHGPVTSVAEELKHNPFFADAV